MTKPVTESNSHLCFDIGELEKKYHLDQNNPKSLHKVLRPSNRWNAVAYVKVYTHRFLHLLKFRQKINTVVIHEYLKISYGKDAQRQFKYFKELSPENLNSENKEEFIKQWENLQKLVIFFKNTVLQNALGKILKMDEWSTLHSSFNIAANPAQGTPSPVDKATPPPTPPPAPPVIKLAPSKYPLLILVMEKNGRLNHVEVEPKRNAVEKMLEDEGSKAAQVFKLADLRARELEGVLTSEEKLKLDKEAADKGAFCSPDEWEDVDENSDDDTALPVFNKDEYIDGFNAYGYDKEGYDKYGYDRYNRDKAGKYRDLSTEKKAEDAPLNSQEPNEQSPVETSAAPTTPRKINPKLFEIFGGEANSSQKQSIILTRKQSVIE